MKSANDPLELFLNSIQVVKNAFSPLELGIQRAAKDLENCWKLPKSNRSNNLESNVTENGNNNTKVQIFAVKKMSFSNSNGNNGNSVAVSERKKGLSIKFPVKTLLGMHSMSLENGCNENNGKSRAEAAKKGSKNKEMGTEDGSCKDFLQLAITWSLLVSNFIQAFPSPFKTSKKHGSKVKVSSEFKQREWFMGFIFDQLAHSLQKFNQILQQMDINGTAENDYSTPSPASSQFDHLRAVMSINGLFGNLKFAKVGDVPSSIVGVSSSVSEGGDGSIGVGSGEQTGGSQQQKLASGLLGIPLSNVERLRSTLSTVSLNQLAELVPQPGQSSKDHPDKKKLISVQDFFRYTESEGMRFFEELDRDGDGQVTLEDLEIAMRKRKLPSTYAREFMRHTRSHLFSKSFGWKQFLSVMEQREQVVLRAYTSLCLDESGTLKKSDILASLKNAGLPANEDNAVAMIRFLNTETEDSVSYGHFRNFMLLLPFDRLRDGPRSVWFEAATVASAAPSVEESTGSVLRSALAGGLSCAFSCAIMHPVDTVKTQVQASTLTLPKIISKIPEIGLRGLFKGSIPAILGQFSSHGLRTGICEASKAVLINVGPTLPEIQVESISSFCGTFLGTAARIPCEVLKQRLQAGQFDNVGQAIIDTWQEGGLKRFFSGTGVTLCREIPFYVAGMGLYAESKKFVQHVLRRELEPWETIVVGALTGGLTGVFTTPFDVVKTRMMTAQGSSIPMAMVAVSILRHEGPLALYRGAVPRFFWIAPLGAINFAGYELARKALDRLAGYG